MNEDTLNLLKECSQGAKMALGSIEHVMEATNNKEMYNLLEDYKKAHEEIDTKLEQLLAKYDEKSKEPNKISQLFANITTNIKMSIRNSEHETAKLLIDGCNMGIQSISEYINKYGNASKESIETAEKLVALEQQFMDDFRKFL